MDIKVPYQRVQRDLINKGEFVTMFLAIKKKKKAFNCLAFAPRFRCFVLSIKAIYVPIGRGRARRSLRGFWKIRRSESAWIPVHDPLTQS